MPAVQTQQLATIADLDQGPADSAMVEALAMFDDATKTTYLRRASGVVLAAYGVRFGRALGSSFKLVNWGDFTIALVVSVTRWMMISDRGFNPANSADKTIQARYDETTKILDQIIDITNKAPRFDPDASDGTPFQEELGSLSCSEGGALDEADHWAGGTGGGNFYPHDGTRP